MSSERLAIVTINYNNYPITQELLDSLKSQTDHDFHVFVVDVSDKKRKMTYPTNVTLVDRPNKGYSFAVNEGTHQAIREGFELIVEMNNDTEVRKDFVHAIKKSLSKHPTSLIGPKIYYYPGYEFHTIPKKDVGQILWFAGGKIDWNNVYVHHRGVDEKDNGQYDKEKNVEFLTGCCIAYTADTFKAIGDWDESYFLYYEDTDWCVRAKKKGFKLVYDPSIVLWHKNAQSTGGSGSTIHTRYQNENRIRFGLRYAPFRTKIHLLKNLFFEKFF